MPHFHPINDNKFDYEMLYRHSMPIFNAFDRFYIFVLICVRKETFILNVMHQQPGFSNGNKLYFPLYYPCYINHTIPHF